MSVFLLILQTLRSWVRSRTASQLEVAALQPMRQDESVPRELSMGPFIVVRAFAIKNEKRVTV